MKDKFFKKRERGYSYENNNVLFTQKMSCIFLYLRLLTMTCNQNSSSFWRYIQLYILVSWQRHDNTGDGWREAWRPSRLGEGV